MKIRAFIEIVIDEKSRAINARREGGQTSLEIKSYMKRPSRQNLFLSLEVSIVKLLFCGAICGLVQLISIVSFDQNSLETLK
jgi:hypothetical protein